jgi:hypothetical protein
MTAFTEPSSPPELSTGMSGPVMQVHPQALRAAASDLRMAAAQLRTLEVAGLDLTIGQSGDRGFAETWARSATQRRTERDALVAELEDKAANLEQAARSTQLIDHVNAADINGLAHQRLPGLLDPHTPTPTPTPTSTPPARPGPLPREK